MAKVKRGEAYSEIQRQVGERIRWAREIVYPNQSELGRLMGVDQSTLNKHESGDRAPSIFVVIQLANRLRVSTDYILRGLLNAKSDEELGLQLAALHPELVLGQKDRATGTDTGRVSDSAPQPKKADPVT